MKFEDLQIGMFISVTDEYRAIIPASITWGKGQGKVIGFEKGWDGGWDEEPDIDIPKIEWASGFENMIHPKHLQPSTKKNYFIAVLQG